MAAKCIECLGELGDGRYVLCAATEKTFACLCGECAARYPSREAAFARLEQVLGVQLTPEDRQRLAMDDVRSLAAAG